VLVRISSLIAETEDGDYEVVLRKKSSKRSENQNRLYRVWVRLIAQETGNTEPDIHDYLRYMFLRESVTISGESVVKIPSTTELTVEQMSSYMRYVEVFAAQELGITLPTNEDEII
jgi:hypothetical protein